MIFTRLLLAELKSMVYKMPKILAGAAVMAVLAVLFIIIITSQKGDNGKNIIAISAPDDIFTSAAINAVENMDSVSKLCKVARVNEEEAEAMVRDNRASAALIFGENFVENIINGNNIQPRIIVNKSGNELFMELARCGSSILAIVQASVYSAQQAYYEQTGKKITGNINKQLNMEYINTVFSRESDFEKSRNNNVNTLMYYCSMLIPVILLLLAMAFTEIVYPEDKKFYDYSGLNYGFVTLIQFIKIFIIEFIMFSVIFFICYKNGIEIKFNIIPVVEVCAIITAVYSIAKNKANSSLFLLFFIVILGFVGGCFLPTAFLPEILRDIMEYSPLYVIGNQFIGTVNISYTVVMILAAVVIACMGGVRK